MWFSSNDIKIYDPIKLSDLRGYVLPHASTKYTGEIISHTLRFRPIHTIRRIYIIYYPATKEPDVEGMYHEYYVPWKSLELFYSCEFIGVNINEEYDIPKVKKDELIVVSADFSHFLPLQEALKLENKAAHSLMFRELGDTEYNSVIDDKKSFIQLYTWMPHVVLQWVGRTRSPGMKGVGYLSFLIRDIPKPHKNKPNGMFVTAYDKDMNSRECLGEWFTHTSPWAKRKENQFVNDVLRKGSQTSRLTAGANKEIPISHYTITYLYNDRSLEFIRGWHGLRKKAFYLSDVFLENTYEDGRWIKQSDKSWSQTYHDFNLRETFLQLQTKSGLRPSGHQRTMKKNDRYHLYTERVIHKSVSS